VIVFSSYFGFFQPVGYAGLDTLKTGDRFRWDMDDMVKVG
jgi:hypothetical protein